MSDKKSEKISIICPCGHNFQGLLNEEGGEYPCPACGRVNILAGTGKSVNNAPSRKGGETTVQAAPVVPRIQVGDRIGPYRITGFVGEGGMGRVYSAEDVNLQRVVAIKILSHQLIDKRDFVVRFEREARAIARLNSPHIVQIYFTGVHEGLPYYVMEMVPGGSLDAMKAGERLDAGKAVDLLLQAARGLRAAGEEGVIHRDIKPSNLMVDKTGRLKITDFGLAKTVAIDSAITHTGTIIGTPYYMSPEQGEGGTIDERGDIYSLGATFYHLLCGEPPFSADSPIGVILKHINERLPPLRSRNKEVPRDLARVIETMMAKSPLHRYKSYAALIRDLEALQKGKAPQAALNAPVPVEASQRKSFIVLDRDILSNPEEIILRRCGWFRRLFALAADCAILGMLYLLYLNVFRDGQTAPFNESIWAALFLLITFLYFFLGDARGGMTLGKILLHCRVGLRNGENIGFMKSLVRTLLFFPVLAAPGAVPDGEAPVEFMKSFFKAFQVLSGANGAAELFAKICVIWIFISFGYFLVAPGRTFLHDLMSASFVFAFTRRPVKEEALEEEKPVPAPSPVKPMPPPIPRDARPVPPAPRRMKNPMLAMTLSLFPGLGQFYNGDFTKGLLIMATCWLIFPWIVGIFDAYFKARMINRRAANL